MRFPLKNTKINNIKQRYLQELIESLQECKNLKPEIAKYDDLLILNPSKNIWPENI